MQQNNTNCKCYRKNVSSKNQQLQLTGWLINMIEHPQEDFASQKEIFVKQQGKLDKYIQGKIPQITADRFSDSCERFCTAITARYDSLAERPTAPEEIEICKKALASAEHKILDTIKIILYVNNHADPEFIQGSLVKYDKDLLTPEARNKAIENLIKDCTRYFYKKATTYQLPTSASCTQKSTLYQQKPTPCQR